MKERIIPNPYESPSGEKQPPADLVDRSQRAELAAAIRRFLDISRVRQKNPREDTDPILYPFDSFADLRAVYATNSKFKKMLYPRQIAQRRIRAPIVDGIMQIKFYMIWMLFAPIPLFFQILPLREIHTRVVVEEDSPTELAINR